eukprot:3444798-Ditylum_brightwellii.AAC.3
MAPRAFEAHIPHKTLEEEGQERPTKWQYLGLLVGIKDPLALPLTMQVFQAATKQSKALLQISSALPHLQILLGEDQDNEGNPSLEGGCNTMRCANVGNIAYHRLLAKKCLHLVSQFEHRPKAIQHRG